MRKYRAAIGMLIVVGITSYLLFSYAANLSLGPSVPKPRSDLSITSDLGQWPFQKGLVVTGFTAEPVNPRLNLFNGRFLMRYWLTGIITCEKGIRPSLAKVQVTHQLITRSVNGQPSVAAVLLVPVVEVTSDNSYLNLPVPFAVKLEETVQTMDWGNNEYKIRCLDKEAVVSVQQGK